MKEEIAVSICCLAYNHEKYIRHTLEGFVNQKTNFRFEVLIHDDASTDGTAAIIREYEEKYPELIKPIYQAENQYSQGIKIGNTYQYPRAKGKYICWCEGDDYWCSENKLQKQYDAMEAHPECSICTCRVECVNEDGTPNERVIPDKSYNLKQGQLSKDDIALVLWEKGGYPFHTSSFFVKRAVVDYIKEHSDVFRYLNGDENIIRASLCLGIFYYIDETMSKRRLLSIGGYNYRKKTWTEQANVAWNQKYLNGELAFNKHTNGIYEEKIKRFCANNILGWCLIDSVNAEKMLTTACITWQEVKHVKSVKRKIYYILLEHCMPAFKFIQLLRRVKHKFKHADI